jgi:hypothetical protein
MRQVAIPWNSPITSEGNHIVGRIICVGDHQPQADIDLGLATAKDRPIAAFRQVAKLPFNAELTGAKRRCTATTYNAFSLPATLNYTV